MIFYDIFFRRAGIRLPSHLMSPRFISIEDFSFPKNSIHHFTVLDNIAEGPSINEYLYRDIQKKIFVSHVLEIGDDKGNPRRISLPLEPMVREFHIRNKRYRRSYDILKQPTDENTLAVINYALITKAYRYMKSIYTEYNRWWNNQKTIFKEAARVASQSERHQFIFLENPKVLPSYVRLNTFVDKFNQQMINYFRDPNALMILEIWKWLDPKTRDTSLLGTIHDSDLKKINLVFQDAGKLAIFNLGLLDSWIFTEDRVREDQKVKISVEKIRKLFLRLLMSLMEFRTVDAAVDPELERNFEKKEVSDSLDSEDDDDLEGNTTKVNDRPDLSVPEEPIEPTNTPKDTKVPNEDRVLEEELTEDEKFALIEKDLEQLELIEKDRELEETLAEKHKEEGAIAVAVDKSPINIADFDVPQDTQSILKETCDNLADAGLMSAAEYRKYIKQVDLLNELDAPYGKEKITEFVKVTEKDTNLPEKKVFKDNYNVIDKGMLETSLEDMQDQYINKVLNKNIVAMPLAMQKAGFVVSDYKVEEHEDLTGHTETHVIKINPLVGKASTLRIKIPKVTKEGHLVSGNSSYKLRLQRVD